MLCPVVAIGASAGGLEAVSELLAALPPRTGMAYIVVQHLDPAHESMLAEILATKTAMQVVQAEDGMVVEPDHVYVIPPNATLTLGTDRLRVRSRETGRHMPVDTLFRSLADGRADRAIGVVLSGGDADGSLGLQAIKHEGGIVFAQEPASARFPSMPRNAIETECVDFVLRPEQIARELVRLGRHPYLRSRASTETAAHDSARAAETPIADENLRRVFRRLRTAHGVDFTHYKPSTLLRRLARRMAVQKIEDPATYVAMIESDPAEAATLYQDFLIRVTGFFRDPEAFEALAQQVFPRLLERRSPKESIRIWVPGCATGEEVYSIAMALVEYLGDRPSPGGIQIFATDVSEVAIERARVGAYLETITHEVSDARLARFFVKQNGQYRIAKSLRDLCIFARHDVTRDPPFSRLDLVSCRNLLIYLDATAQRRVMQVFHFALRPHGVLMLGSSEGVGQATDLFDLVDKHHRLFARKVSVPGAGLDLARREPSAVNGVREAAERDASIARGADSAQSEADRLLLARFAPASLLVDDALNILQFRGETGPYLEHASGPSSLNLNRVARPELLVEIVPAIQEARESGAEAHREGLSVGALEDVSIEVIPLKSRSAGRCFLILLEGGSRPHGGRRARQASTSSQPQSESEKDRRIAQLGREMASVRDYLQATLEEHEAVKEELRSAHEEVLSANEEFQSTNEELETAREELQSANEELTTTNEELRNRNRELVMVNAELEKARAASEDARAYGDAIVETVREPLLVLDDELRILRVNQAFYDDFEVRPAKTLGRFVYDLGDGQWNIPLLRERLDAVLTRNEPMTNHEITYDSAGGRRMLSLSARRIPGEHAKMGLLAIEDVTERRADTESLREMNRHKDEFLAMLAHELRNPLSPIEQAIHLLQQAQSDASTTGLYALIERQTKKLTRLVDELLDVARITRGGINLKLESVDLVTVARHAVETIRPRIEEYGHELSLELPDAPTNVYGDPLRLEQVVFNLLENAAKYTDPGGRIFLAIRAENGEAVLRVRDTGIGLGEEMLDKVFDLFVQANTSLARSSGGLGLGLNVVRRILELHGGRIEAHSEGIGQGSEFIAWLPLLPSTQKAAQRGSGAEPRKTGTSGRTVRVLVVDDNRDSAESLALLMRSWGHDVAVARDGPEALETARSFGPEIAFLDIGLPDMDGCDLARRLRQDPIHRDLQLVALSGYAHDEQVAAARAAGFDLHLVKPTDLRRLKDLLARGGPRPGPGR